MKTHSYTAGHIVQDFWKQASAAQQTPTPDVVGIAPELVERMVGLVRRLSTSDICSTQTDNVQQSIYDARAIVALLPEPVDGDVIEARKIAAAHCDDPLDGIRFINGERDEGVALPPILAALRRGRALERGEA